MFFAAAKKLPVVAVAAVVPQPLNSIMAIDPKVKRVADLRRQVDRDHRRTVRLRRRSTPRSRQAGLDRSDVKVVTLGYSLLPALLAHRVDAVLGVYRNVEGIELERRGLKPTIIPLNRAGVPFYDELVLVASSSRLHSDPAYADTVQRFVRAFRLGTTGARNHPGRSLAILRKATGSDAGFLARATPATLALLAGTHGVGCMRTAEWQRFGAWMLKRGIAEERGSRGIGDDDPLPAAELLEARPHGEQYAAAEGDVGPRRGEDVRQPARRAGRQRLAVKRVDQPLGDDPVRWSVHREQ